MYFFRVVLCLLGLLLSISDSSSQPTPTPNWDNQIIDAYVGTGQAGYAGDNGLAINANLRGPRGITCDYAGNLYIVDRENHCIRVVNAKGFITTIAGTGVLGFNDDRIFAKYAQLNEPYDVAVDFNGNIYISDSGNNRVRKITTDGLIDTIAGIGEPGYSPSGSVAKKAKIHAPAAIAVDRNGNVYFASHLSSVIQKIDADGYLHTLAGIPYEPGYNGENLLGINTNINGGEGLFIDDAGVLFFAEYSNNRVRKIDTNGVVSTVAGTGMYGYNGDNIPATKANLSNPTDITKDTNGFIYIADNQNHRIRRIDLSGNIITLAGKGDNQYSGDGGRAIDAYLYFPIAIALDYAGNAYITDVYNHRIRKITNVASQSPPPTVTSTPTILPTPTPTPANWIPFSGATLQENLLNADPPASYNSGTVLFTTIPSGSLTDGQGMEIRLAPGQGMLVVARQSMEVSSLARITGAFRASNQNVTLALVALNSPIDGQLAYTNLTAGEVPVSDYRQFNLFYDPPSDNVQLAVQAVNSSLSSLSTIVWVDNLRMEAVEPVDDGTPLALEVDGSFDKGIDKLITNINYMDGSVTPFFESLSDIALRLTVDPSTLAANVGTRVTGASSLFPMRVLGQIGVKRELPTAGGTLAFVMTNGFQNIGLFRFANSIPTTKDAAPEYLILGGDFTVNNPNIPIHVVIQNAGPNVESSVVVDDLMVVKK